MSVWWMETSANLKSQVTWTGKSLYSTLWYYWKIVEEFCLKCSKFKQVDQLVRDNLSLTLVKGGHLWLKLSKCFTLGCIVYFYLFKISVSQNKRPQRFFPSRSLELLPAWAAILDSPWWATRRNRAGRLLRVRNLCLLYLCVYRYCSFGCIQIMY